MRKGTSITASGAFAFAVACGYGGPYSLAGSANVGGTVGGQTLAANDAISNLVSVGDASQVLAAWILITTVPDECGVAKARQMLKSGSQLLLALGISPSPDRLTPPTMGTYTVSADAKQRGRVAAAGFSVADASCLRTSSVQATSGVVTLTRVDETGYGGIFDLVFADPPGRLTGTFNTGTCSSFGTNPIDRCPR